MLVYRLSLTIYAKDISGEGSRLFGGRWNKPGTGCIYTAESRALTVLESLVRDTIDTNPHGLSIITFDVPDENVLVLKQGQLPDGWNAVEVSEVTQNFGSAIIAKGEHLMIGVPSVVIPQEYNYIINPAHVAIKSLKIKNISNFSFDTRLKK